MNKLYKNILLVFSLFVLTSCYTTSRISVEILRPAELTLPSEIRNIAVINQCLLNIPDSLLNDTLIITESLPEYLYNITSTEAVKSLGSFVREIPSLINILSENILETLPEDSIYVQPLLNNNELLKLASELDVDGLITLDYIYIFDKIGTEMRYQIIKGYYEPYYVAYISRKFAALWRLYDLNRLRIIDETLFVDSLKFYAPSSDWELLQAVENMFEDRNFINSNYIETGIHLGYNFSKRISPSYRIEEREYYSGKASWLKRSGKLISQYKLDKAENILLSYIRHENNQKAAAAFYNLALISELDNDLELARFYVKMALKQYQSGLIVNYLDLLEKRIVDKKNIDKQLVF